MLLVMTLVPDLRNGHLANGDQQELIGHRVGFHDEAPHAESQTRAILPDFQVTELSVRYRYTTRADIATATLKTMQKSVL